VDGRGRYLSLATYRASGAEIATPVWFASVGDTIYVFTAGDSGKVKRLRRSSRARIARLAEVAPRPRLAAHGPHAPPRVDRDRRPIQLLTPHWPVGSRPSCRMARMPSNPDRTLEIVTDVPDKAMVIFAHPDDAEIGSGGVVARWIAEGCEVTYVLCTNGQAGTADRSLTSEQLARKRAEEQRAAADFMGVKNLVMLGYPDGELEDTREVLGDVVRAIRQYRPHTVFVHDPYRINGFQHRDHRKAGIVATDAVYPYARDHLHFAEQISRDGLEPHRVRELWYWGMDRPTVIVDVSESIERQIAALIRHESQLPGFNVPAGQSIGERVRKNAAELAESYGFGYGAAFRRLIARR
jgi:LmbE family N-acetylglucosaminyl deacetylase